MFGELYGQELSQRELKRYWCPHGSKSGFMGIGLLKEKGEPWPQPFHCGWSGGGNYSQDYPDGDYRHSGSWTFRKIIRPSYRRETTVDLVVSVHGLVWLGMGTRARKCPRRRWSAQVHFGRLTERVELPKGKSCLGCASLADAKRQAEKLPDLDDAVRRLLTRAYSPEGAECIFVREGGTWDRYEGSFRVKPDETWRPFGTLLAIDTNPYQLPFGRYFYTRWEWPFSHKEPQWRIGGSCIDRNGSGYCSGGYIEPGAQRNPDPEKAKAEHQAFVDRLGCWTPKPEDRK